MYICNLLSTLIAYMLDIIGYYPRLIQTNSATSSNSNMQPKRTCDYMENLFCVCVGGNACEMAFAEDVAVLICCRAERVRSLRLAEETDGKRRGR